MGKPKHRTCLAVRTFLAFLTSTRSNYYQRLSPNVLREVCSYFHPPARVAGITEDKLVLYDLKGLVQQGIRLQERFTMGSVFAVWDEDRVVGVGDAPATTRVFRVNLASGNCKELASMSTKRRFPGVIRYGAFIYVFGSGDRPILSTCEKYSVALNSWTPLPNTHTGKWAFAPCLCGTRIYLPCTTKDFASFEVFDPKSDLLEALPIVLRDQLDGSVSFLVRDVIYVLTCSGQVGKLGLKQGTWEVVTTKLAEETNALSSAVPLVHLGKVYWSNYSKGTLVKFNLVLDIIEA